MRRWIAIAFAGLVLIAIVGSAALRTPRPRTAERPLDRAHALRLKPVTGRVDARFADAPARLLGDEAVDVTTTLEVAGVAFLEAGADRLAFRHARVRAWTEQGRPALRLEAGELVLEARGDWEISCRDATIRTAGGCVGLRVTPDGFRLAVARGAAVLAFSAGPIDLEEGEVVDVRGMRVGGSMSADAAEEVAWARR